MKVTNRFKVLDLVDSTSEELWTEVCNIVQETVTETTPKKCKKTKWLPEQVLQIADKRRDAKNKGLKERYTQLHYIILYITLCVMCVYIYIYTHIYKYIYIYIYTHIYICVCVCIHRYMYTFKIQHT